MMILSPLSVLFKPNSTSISFTTFVGLLNMYLKLASGVYLVNYNTVNLVNFACLDFLEFVIWGLFANSIIRKLSISMIGSTINKRNSRICPPSKIREK